MLALFFLGSGVIVSLTGWTFIQTIARLFLTVAVGISAVFFTYDTIHYYRYADELRTRSQPMDVGIQATNRHTHGRSRKSQGWRWYTYDATFRFQGQ